MKKLLILGVSAAAVAMTGVAQAADIPTPPPVFDPPPAAAPPSDYWTGAYFGGHVGWAWNDFDSSDLCQPLDPRDQDSSAVSSPLAVGSSSDDVGPNPYGLEETLGGVTPAYSCRPFETLASGGGPGNGNDDVLNVYDDEIDGDDGGLVFGGFIGNNWQKGNMVFSVELEGTGLQGTDSERNFNFAYFENSGGFLRGVGAGTFFNEGPDWMATGSVRIGHLIRPDTLLYLRGGFSVADSQSSSFDGEVIGGGLSFDGGSDCDQCSGALTTTLVDNGGESGYGFGGTVGVGLEHMHNSWFGLGAEYQFSFIEYTGSHDVDFIMQRDCCDPGDVRETTFSNQFLDYTSHQVKVRATVYLNN